VAALKTVEVQKLLLHGRKRGDRAVLVTTGVTFNRAQLATIEVAHPGNTGTDFIAVPVFAVKYDDTGPAYTLPTTQPCSGQVRIVVQEIYHHQRFGHLR